MAEVLITGRISEETAARCIAWLAEHPPFIVAAVNRRRNVRIVKTYTGRETEKDKKDGFLAVACVQLSRTPPRWDIDHVIGLLRDMAFATCITALFILAGDFSGTVFLDPRIVTKGAHFYLDGVFRALEMGSIDGKQCPVPRLRGSDAVVDKHTEQIRRLLSVISGPRHFSIPRTLDVTPRHVPPIPVRWHTDPVPAS